MTGSASGGPAPQNVLAAVGLFGDLDSGALQRLERLGRRRRFGPGEVIMRQGDGGIALFAVLGGRVRVSRRGADGQEQALRTIGPGGYFGEMALLSNRPRSATVAASPEGEVECLVLHRLDFLEEVRRQPELAVRLLETLSRRLEDAERR
ncbi:MAG TPA: cyclic nucleotide-binding domain-containing protein [Chloroflexota bacterium]|jgi:CRP-like cAMP-binding protein|nr:cyclic nucleotide-binding domain-containing protein [Chloroflexota bacterium]